MLVEQQPFTKDTQRNRCFATYSTLCQRSVKNADGSENNSMLNEEAILFTCLAC
jgi:hypothetical protein